MSDSPSPAFDRRTLIDALRTGLTSQTDALKRMISASRDEATSSESKAENKYDTRATEASYLAAGQGRRLEDLLQLATWASGLDEAPRSRISLGAVAHVRFEDDSERWLMLAPQGGTHVRIGRPGPDRRIELVGVGSPIGRALLGCVVDDAVEVPTPAGERELEVLAVH